MKYMNGFNNRKIAVIGGGPAGLMAAFFAAESGAEVILFEKNKMLGKKLRITGKGRCNLTNNCDINEFIENVRSSGKFLYSALSRFSPTDTIAFFEGLGVKLKTERGKRVFPVSDSAKEVADALAKAVLGKGVKVVNSEIKDIKKVIAEFDAVIIATGGKSYSGTGSTGDGYKFAKELGHSVTPLYASLVPLECEESFCEELMGLALKNISVKYTYFGEKKPFYSDFGELLFTHFGVSGPTVLSASAHIKKDFCGCELSIDLKPALSSEQLDKRILRDFEEMQNKQISNALIKLLPSALIPVCLAKAEISGEKKVNEITKKERANLINTLKNFNLKVLGKRPIEEAVVTGGGISCKEIDAKTMKSKLCDKLYFAGEVLDLDAYTGGFNLQIAFSTGCVAGESAAGEEI